MVQQILRQADVETTRRHYIKALPKQSVAAMAKLEAGLPESCARKRCQQRTSYRLSRLVCVVLSRCGRVAQLAEQCPFKAWVDGSSPSALTIFFSRLEPSSLSRLNFVRKNVRKLLAKLIKTYLPDRS